MDALHILEKFSREYGTILCFGIDPMIEKINSKGTITERIVDFYCEITDRLILENQISAIKPNYAYFAQYGFEGLFALKEIIEIYKNKVFIVLDGKRGDIEKSSEAYAKEAYDFFRSDGITVSPYMGKDSVLPFVQNGKQAYLLCKTSNKGALDFQELKIGKKHLYEYVAEKSVSWKCGLVVGATTGSIKKVYKITRGNTPFLIPGIGSQGGNLEMVLKTISPNPYIHLINSSSSIAFAYCKNQKSPQRAALDEAVSINSKIKKILF
ncbi:MAG: orotidine-5'-phosphate decarboxylase [Candidatus Micrarchaeia archaeon]